MKLGFKIFFAFILALCAWEVLLQITVYRTPGTNFHPVLGKIYNKGTLIWGKEGFSISKFNSFGLRDKEISSKQNGEYRILSLGDSFTEALHVGEAKTYSKRLEALLFGLYSNKYAKDNIRFSVINAGRSGDCPADYLNAAAFYNQKINPDFVIISLNDKDFSDDVFSKNRFVYISKNESKSESGFALKVNKDFVSINPIKQKFPQLAFLADLSSLRLAAEGLQVIFNSFKPAFASGEAHGKAEKNSKNDTAKDSSYKDVVDWSIKNLKEKYKNIAILYIPDIDYEKLSLELTPIEVSIKKSAAKYGVPFVDMKKDFIDHYKQTKEFSSGFGNTTPGTGHINELGHDLTAHRLARLFKGNFLKNEIVR